MVLNVHVIIPEKGMLDDFLIKKDIKIDRILNWEYSEKSI